MHTKENGIYAMGNENVNEEPIKLPPAWRILIGGFEQKKQTTHKKNKMDNKKDN